MSLISRIFSFIIRRRFKQRRPPEDEGEFVRLARELMDDPRRIPRRTPDDIEIEVVDSREGVGGCVRGEWVKQKGADESKAIVYFHGGGYIGGSALHYRKTTFHLARLTKARIFVVEYRLAPEHRFPHAVEDGYESYRYVLDELSRHGSPETAARRVAFAGDSAGGGLLLATMHKVRKENLERGEKLSLPAAAVCFSPYTDLALTGESIHTNERSCVMFYADTFRIAAPIYLGGADPEDPLASPLYGDFEGFPPLMVFASTTETLLSDSLNLIERAEGAGVTVERKIEENMPHVWPAFPEYLPEARTALRETADFIKGVWAKVEKRADARGGAESDERLSGASAAPASRGAGRR